MGVVVDKIEQEQRRREQDFRPGDRVRVHVRIVEGDKERIQVFEGVVISIRGSGSRASFTVRKVSYGVGVERIFPIQSPSIDKIEIISSGRVRRAKLYYLRERTGKAARLKERDRGTGVAQVLGRETAADEAVIDTVRETASMTVAGEVESDANATSEAEATSTDLDKEASGTDDLDKEASGAE